MVYQGEQKKAQAAIDFAKETGEPLIVFDTETTGLSPQKDRIIEISARKLDPETLRAVNTFSSYIRPESSLSSKIVEITGITDEFLSHHAPERVVFPHVEAFFGESPIVIGHNVAFDIRMLSALYERNGYHLAVKHSIDTCQMARECLSLNNYKLSTVARYLGADAGLVFHEAGDDVTACMRAFLSMYQPGDKEHTNKATIENVRYYNGYRGHSRVYVDTNRGTIFYDGLKKTWDGKDIDIEKIDVEDIRQSLYFIYQVGNDDEVLKAVKRQNLEKETDQFNFLTQEEEVLFEKKESDKSGRAFMPGSLQSDESGWVSTPGLPRSEVEI